MAGSSSEDWRRRHGRGGAGMPGDEEPEEGEIVPGDHSDEDTEDYYNRHSPLSDDSDETISACSVVPEANCGGGARSPSFSVVAGSYGGASASSPVAANNIGNTTNASSPVAATNVGNTNDASSASVVAAPAPAVQHACPVCGKEFRSSKAVCGHMKVHQIGIGLHQEQRKLIKGKGIKRERDDVAVVAAGWGGTGKRGCSGTTGTWSRASSSTAEPDHHPMDIVVAQPEVVMQAMPLAFAPPNPSPLPMASAIATPNPTTAAMASSTMTNVSGESSSAKQTTHNDAMETVVVAGAASPSAEAAVHLLHAADAAPAPPQPAPPAGVQDSAAAHQQPTERPPPPAASAVERAPAVHQQPAAAPPRVAKAAGRQNPNGYRCPHCNMWFERHQGLGGHMAGHKNKELAAGMLRDDGAGPSRRNDKPKKEYKCKLCGAVYDTGVQLGGHMRKHYTGPRIVPKRKPRLAINHQPLRLLPPAEQPVADPAPAMADNNAHEAQRGPAVEEAAAAQPAPSTPTPVQPAPPTPTPVQMNPEPAPRSTAMAGGRVILFGVDIGAGKQKQAAKDGSSSSTQGSASAPGEQ